MKKPTLEQWQQLYQAADQFKQSKCWNWMYDNDNFGVEDPQTGDVAYCSILGNAGKLVGIVAYTGEEGLLNLTEQLLGDTDSEEMQYKQQCLALAYGNRDELRAEDLKTIHALGLKFRGKGQWPQFRDYAPGKLPWFLNKQGCSFLTHIIRQAVLIAERCKRESVLTGYPQTPKLLVRVPVKGSASLLWEDQYRSLEVKDNCLVLGISDELLLRRLKNIKRSAGIWEVETFYCPIPIAEKKGDRPTFTQMCLFVEHQSGMILGYRNFRALKEDGENCLDLFVELMSAEEAKPVQLLVRKKETYYLFEEVSKQLGIPLTVVSELENIKGIKEKLFQLMG